MKNIFRRGLIITFALLQIALYPHIGFALEGAATDGSTSDASAPTITTNGPSAPTGADASTYIYNDVTGLWENEYYTWDPVTKLTAPKTSPEYSYNPTTEHWDTNEWRYDAPSGKYIPNIIENVVPPVSTLPASTSLVADSSTSSNSPTALSTLGPNSPAGLNSTSNNSGDYSLFYNASISNKIINLAQTGDASVLGNTFGGSALTGNALTQATILNLLQSVWNPANGNILTFTSDINGDVTGDITLDPALIPRNLTAATETSNNTLKVNQSNNTAILNDINLAATSGDARIDSNTSAGDATTGSATAVANVVNLINSVIGSGQSFVGTVNINGNLNGDILLPPEMLNQLLASNVPRVTIDTNSINNSNILADFNNNQTINNNVTTDAASGNAHVSGNSSAGNATTGSAANNLTILNLTGRDIIGSNAMLVFVNVLGKWVGMIVDAPGATSAALGGGITSDTTRSLDAVIKSDSTQTITNNINLVAHTGDADITNNTSAGNAKTGDAKTSAGIANVSNSNLALGGWFGVLFINVFGNWFGSFGVNTAAGNTPAPVATISPDIKVFQFVPNSSNTASFRLRSIPTIGNIGTAPQADTQDTEVTGTVLGASSIKPSPVLASASEPLKSSTNALAYIGFSAVSILAYSLFRLFTFVKGRNIVA